MGGAQIVIRTGGLGDLVLFYPVLKELSARHGEPLTLITSSSLVPVMYEHCSFLKATHIIRCRKLPKFLNRSLRQMNRLAREPIANLYDFDGRIDRVTTFAKLKKVATRTMSSEGLPGRGLYEHEADGRLRMVSETPEVERVTPEGFPATVRPIIPVTERELAACGTWLESLGCTGTKRILLQAGNKMTMKRGGVDRPENRKYWSASKWAEVIDSVLAKEECMILLCGTPSEGEWVEAIRAKCSHRERVINVARDLSIRRLMALSRMPGSYYLGVDTGPAHVAAAMGCPCCILYGPSSKVNFLPLSWGQLIIPLEKLEDEEASYKKWISPSIGLISVEEVIAATLTLLDAGGHSDSSEYLSSTVISG